MKRYVLTKFYNNAERYIGECKSKKLAIEVARKLALANKNSVFITMITNDNNKYIGVAEYPVYLRNLELDIKDIHFVNAEPY